jgi:hypothetical protein
MAKKKIESPENATLVGVEADGTASMKLYLSNGSELIVLSAGGGDWKVNRDNRDLLVDVLTRTIQNATLPAPQKEVAPA